MYSRSKNKHLKNDLNKKKFKQLNISSFCVPYKNVRAVNKMEHFNKSFKKKTVNLFSNTSEDIDNNNRGDLPYPLPRFVRPASDSIVIISDDELDVTPTKRNKREPESLSPICDKYPTLRLKKTSNLVCRKKLDIGVFPPTKVDLVSKTSNIPRILQENSKGDGELSFRTFVSDKSIEVVLSDELPELSPTPQALFNLRNVTEDTSNIPPTLLSRTEVVFENNCAKKVVVNEINNEHKINKNYLRNFKHIYSFVSSNPWLSMLLKSEEIETINIFLYKLDERSSYLCIRLFMRLQKWINIIKLKNDIKLNMPDSEVKNMFDELSNYGFIVSDFSLDAPVDLLHLLTVADIRDICKSFKLQTNKGNKSDLIRKLLQNCNHQRVLISNTSTTAVLFERIKEKLGICIKLKVGFYNILQKIHLLYSFTSRDFKNYSDLYFYLDQLLSCKIILPEYYINQRTQVFSSIEEFESYIEANDCRNTMFLETEKKQMHFVLEVCELAYKKLLSFGNNLPDRVPKHFIHYTPDYIYSKALSLGVQLLTKHYHKKAEVFLKFLLERKGYVQNMRGSWYDLLIMIQYNYSKQHEVAAETIIEALSDETLSEVDIRKLNSRAESIKRNKSHRLSKLLSDRICFAQSTGKLPFIEIDACAVASEGSAGKKRYIENVDGVVFIRSVEELALSHYNTLGYSHGIHCEGSLIAKTLYLLLWDKIYDHSIPDVFISEIQHLPLDFYTKEFYIKRKDAIDELLNNIAQTWSNDELYSHIKENWDKHSCKKPLIDIDLSLDCQNIFEIILCITREKVVTILRRILSDIKGFRSGMPDLFVWNPITRLCKFVEVKSEKDRLAHNQDVWLTFLKSIGCKVELCYVHSTGTKSRARFRRKHQLQTNSKQSVE